MIPYLRRFYGGTCREWLTMPGRLLDIHIEEMPRLQAREALQEATIAAVGGGNLKKHDLNAIRNIWLREAGLNPRPEKPKDAQAMKTRLADMGIGFKET